MAVQTPFLSHSVLGSLDPPGWFRDVGRSADFSVNGIKTGSRASCRKSMAIYRTPQRVGMQSDQTLESLSPGFSGEKSIQIFVRGLSGRTILLDVRLSMTIDDIKKVIETRLAVPAHEQRLIFGGKQLEGSRSLADYNIQRESTLHLLLSLQGGSESSGGIGLDVVRRFAPVFRFHPNEETFPCSIEHLVEGGTLNFRNFWFAKQVSGSQSSLPFSIVPFNDWLYMAYITSSQLKLAKSQNGSDWEAVTTFPSITKTSAPSITVFQGQLWIVYSIPKASQVWAIHSEGGQTFSAPERITSLTASLAVVAVFDDNLFIVHLREKSPDLWMTQSKDGRDWSTSRQLEGQQAVMPALAVFHDELVMAYINPTNSQLCVSRYKNATGWTLPSKIRENGPAKTALTVIDGRLCLAYSMSRTSELCVCRSNNAVTWQDPVQIPDQKGTNIALSVIANDLIIVYNAPKSSQLWFTECPGGDINPHPPLQNITQAMLRENSGDHFYVEVNSTQYPGQPIRQAPLYYAVQEYEDGVEITYILIYAYQGGQTALARRFGFEFTCIIPDLGTHQGDLERLTVRLTHAPNNTYTATHVLYEGHGKPMWYEHNKVTWVEDTHPTVHVALNSHAMRNRDPTVSDRLITDDIPLLVGIGDWMGNGETWSPHSEGNEFRQLGLNNAGQPVSDQLWSAFAGQLGKSRNNTLVKGMTFTGQRLSVLEWIYVKFIFFGGMLIKKIPLDKLVGDGPVGPAQRPWVMPGSGRMPPPVPLN